MYKWNLVFHFWNNRVSGYPTGSFTYYATPFLEFQTLWQAFSLKLGTTPTPTALRNLWTAPLSWNKKVTIFIPNMTWYLSGIWILKKCLLGIRINHSNLKQKVGISNGESKHEMKMTQNTKLTLVQYSDESGIRFKTYTVPLWAEIHHFLMFLS